MSSIFLSYASRDRERVEPLVRALEEAGLSVWWDRQIETGTEFDRTIEAQLDAAQAVVVVWSRSSVESDWVRTEAEEARQRGILVPVRIDDVTPPLAFRRTQTADLLRWPSDSADFDTMLARLANLLGHHTATRPAPVPSKPPARRRSRIALSAFTAALGLVVAVGAWWALRESTALQASDAQGGHPGRLTIAVLPFVNLVGDESQQVFVDGMTEEMIFVLGSINPEALAVIARSSAMYFQNREADLAVIGEKLGAQYLLEGSVRRQQQQVRVNAALIRVGVQTPLWRGSFDRSTEDLLGLQRDMASRIANELAITLLDTAGRKHAPSTAANDAYFEGRYWSHKGSGEGWRRAIEYYREAVRLDPDFALAHANLADAYVNDAVWGGDRRNYEPARSAAETALALNPQLAEAHAAQALVKLFYEWDWTGAERSFRRSMELNPSNGQLLHHYGHYLDFRDRYDEAVTAFDRAQELDPISAFHHNGEAITLIHAGDLAGAERLLERVHELDDQMPIYWYTLGMLRDTQGRVDDAIAAWERAVSLSRVRFNLSALGYGYARAGRIAEAEEIIGELARDWPQSSSAAMERAKVYVGLGDFDRSFALLDEAISTRDPWIIGIRVDVALPTLAADPRYAELLQRLYAAGD